MRARRRGAWRSGLLLLGAWLALLPVSLAAQDISQLRVGHWVQVKGSLGADGIFVGTGIEVTEASDEESFVATPTDVDVDAGTFSVFGLPMATSARTDWHGLTISELDGQVKIEGHYRGMQKFSVRSIELRKNPGRDRIEGRVDGLEPRDGGFALRIMHFTIHVPADVEVEAERPLDQYLLVPIMPWATQVVKQDDDDEVLGSFQLGDDLTFGGRVEWKTEAEDEFDLNETRRRNKTKRDLTLRGQLIWEPTDDFYGLLSAEGNRATDREATKADSHTTDGKINEAFGMWRLADGLDLQVGRQDFDDVREWVYDENLDAVRLVVSNPDMRLELGAGSVFWDGSHRDRHSDTFVAYLSNNDEDQHLAAYVVDRRINDPKDEPPPGSTPNPLQARDDKPIFFGLRAIGDWLPDQDVWADFAVVRGYRGPTDYDGWGLDVGTTWSADAIDPLYLTLSWAVTSGDDDPNDAEDTSFRQTGLNDNNGKFGGITSFRYYGEVFEPELSNMSILTAGVGARLTRKTSLDLVAHSYRQVEAAATVRDSNLDTQPDGTSADLGWGVDLILGSREYDPWELEAVVGVFDPGHAYPSGSEQATFGKLQLRYRF